MLKIAFICCLCISCFGLTLEEKVGQLLMAHFHGEVANEEARVLIQDVKVGGIIYYNWANTLDSPSQVKALSDGLQELATIPLLIAVDQEGGVVSRLNNGFTKFPGNRALGEVGDARLAMAAAFAMGCELRAMGINMNLAPVVDVNSNPRNPVIGVRSFGEDPAIVARLGRASLTGYKNAEVIATLKHFPGHGDVAIDPHLDLPVVWKTIEELQQMELFPFAQLAGEAEAIMTAHILVPALDIDNCATLSKKVLKYLRETIGFQGVIVSDSLVMEGVLGECQTVDEAAILALNAGCDILILGGKLLGKEQSGFELTVNDVVRIHRALVDAVISGRISESRIDEAVQKILALKSRHPSSHAIAKEIASRALKITRNGPMLSFHDKKIAITFPECLRDVINQTPFSKIEHEVSIEEAEILFAFSYNAWKDPSQVTLIQTLIDTGKPVVLIVTRDPLDATLFPGAHLIFTTFSPTVPSLQAVWKALE